MCWSRTGRVLCCAAVVAAWSVAPAWGQTTVYNSNGFESGTFNLGNLTGQQSFQNLPSTGAGQIQNTTTYAGSQALQIVGLGMAANDPYTGGNFWWRAYNPGTGGGPTVGFRPLDAGKPYVYASAAYRMSGAFATGAADIPFAGMHFEGYTSFGIQQMLSPVYLNMNGGLTVITNTTDGQGTNAVTTADLIVPREEWHKIIVEYNFLDQNLRVFIDNLNNPVQFTRNGNNTNLPQPLTRVHFRNSFGDTVQFAEIGAVAYYGKDISGANYQPLNNFYMDDFDVTAYTAPVPEPGLMIALGFGVVAAGGWVRRVRARRA